MSYEDIEAARGKRAAKEAVKEVAATASQKRGRKRKSPAPAEQRLKRHGGAKQKLQRMRLP